MKIHYMEKFKKTYLGYGRLSVGLENDTDNIQSCWLEERSYRRI